MKTVNINRETMQREHHLVKIENHFSNEIYSHHRGILERQRQ